MISAVSTWSDPPPQPSFGDRSKPASHLPPAEDWLWGTSLVLAVVLSAAFAATRSATIGAFVTASIAICATLITWLWTAWLERRSNRVATWRLMAACLAVLGAAQLASAVTVIDDRRITVLPAWIDLLRIAGAALGIAAIEPMIRRRRNQDTADWVLPGSAVIAAASSLVFLIIFRLATSKDLSHSSIDWLIAWAIVAVPLAASLLWWSAVLRPRPDWEFRSLRLAFGWLCLTVAMSGFALDRLLRENLVGPRTSWASLPAAALLATSALGILQHRLNGTFSWFGLTTNANSDPGLDYRHWLRTMVPYLAFAIAVTVAIDQILDWTGPRSAVIVTVISVFAATILVRQTRTQISNARAAKRLELARLELATQANIDPVTGLPNRRALDDRLAEEVERALRYKQPLSLCFIDLDHFKQVNDDHGHSAGDSALRQVGSLLRRTARGIDFVGRFGGEEFVVLVPGTWSEDAATLGERLRRAVAECSFTLTHDRPARLTISIGIAGLPEHAQDAGSLNDCADKALYTAKRSGRNQVVLYEPGT
jgi:diguanylate cyclase (GGDEF)-like protein